MKIVPPTAVCAHCRREFMLATMQKILTIRQNRGIQIVYYLCRPCAAKRKPPTPPAAA